LLVNGDRKSIASIFGLQALLFLIRCLQALSAQCKKKFAPDKFYKPIFTSGLTVVFVQPARFDAPKSEAIGFGFTKRIYFS